MQMTVGERTSLFPLYVKSFYLNVNAITEKKYICISSYILYGRARSKGKKVESCLI